VSALFEPDRAFEAARQVLGRLGASADGFECLRFGSNGVYAAPTAELLLRVSPPGVDPSQGLTFAIEASRVGVPVLAPTSAEVYEAAGCSVTVWPLLSGRGDFEDFGWLGSAARSLHAASDWLQERVPGLKPYLSHQVQVVRDRLATVAEAGVLDDVDVGVLRRELSAVEAALTADDSPAIVAHGDLHTGNVVVGSDGPRLVDFDLISLAPPAWDLSPLRVQVRRFGRASTAWDELIRGYGAELEPSEALLRLRELGASSWLAALSAARRELIPEVLRRMRYWRGEENAPVWQPV
jgi:Phosphotransferase enzyme family